MQTFSGRSLPLTLTIRKKIIPSGKGNFPFRKISLKLTKIKKDPWLCFGWMVRPMKSVLDTVSREDLKNEKAAVKVIAHLNTIF